MGLMVLAKKGGERRALGGLRALAFRILLNGCGSGTQVWSRQTTLLHWEDTVLISERLVTNDSGFPYLSAIVYTCPSKWSTLPSSWVTLSLSVSLTTAAADNTPLLPSCTWYNKKRISRNQKVFSQNSALIPPKAK
ncbi:hypothetical protein HAX54_049714 [Datura stramonium]|uniref:Uncharacterized protein n=1 Tax=Datura stramonium TaxID=4076 RepID=A0ABS8WMT9_DATST|nr:hypothetical protein [Datura stramonium]